MKILITLYYNAELGGLHDNVFATALEAVKRGHDVYVACRRGKFNERLSEHGVKTITIDQDKKVDTINKIIEAIGTNIDLIHTHPGNSRIIAMRLHRQYDIPVIYHVHGSWLDNVDKYIHEVECVFAVSESTKQKVIHVCKGYEEKVHVIPNYSDYNYVNENKSLEKEPVISLITRLDQDKKLIIDEFYKLISLLNSFEKPITINIIGEGSLRHEFLNNLKTKIYNRLVNINYVGWMNDKKELKEKILESTVVIGPGRVAIDSLTLGIPVIVVGSQNYQGIIKEDNWQSIVSNNFGGYGSFEQNANIKEDFNDLLRSSEVYNLSINMGRTIIKTFFNKEDILRKHFNIYEIIESYNSK